jgi:hypothetical protein
VLRNEQAGRGRPVRFAAHRQPLYWNFMYHSRIILSVGSSVWYVVRNLRCTAIIDSVLANSKTQNAFLFPVHAMFRHDCLLAVKPASTPRRLVHKKTSRDSLPLDMLPFGVTIQVTLPQRSEIPEGLVNYPVFSQSSQASVEVGPQINMTTSCQRFLTYFLFQPIV